MKYARYFCGNHDGTVISEEEFREFGEAEAQRSDTIDYEPIFDGRIYPTVSEHTAAQIAAYGCHYLDDRKGKPLSEIPIDELRKMSDEAFSDYYRWATRPCGDWHPGMKFPELENATNRLNEINEELGRRLILDQLKTAAGLEYKGIVFDDFANMFGKPVKDGDEIYLPQDTPFATRRPPLDERIDAAKAKTIGKESDTGRDRVVGAPHHNNARQL